MPTASVAKAIDILKYHNYRWSREHEGTLPSDWCIVWPKEEVDLMEKRYQKERHANVHPVFREVLKGVCK